MSSFPKSTARVYHHIWCIYISSIPLVVLGLVHFSVAMVGACPGGRMRSHDDDHCFVMIFIQISF